MADRHNVLSGFRCGELVVIQRVAPRRKGAINLRNQVRVECSCGQRLTIPTYYLTREGPKQNCGGVAHKSDKTIHNGVYRIWVMMRRRCNNSTHVSYRYYGGRGIRVCPEWDNDVDGFQNFLKHMGPRPGDEFSIDRYPDNDGNYEPGNVRWATDEQQANNKGHRSPTTTTAKEPNHASEEDRQQPQEGT